MKQLVDKLRNIKNKIMAPIDALDAKISTRWAKFKDDYPQAASMFGVNMGPMLKASSFMLGVSLGCVALAGGFNFAVGAPMLQLMPTIMTLVSVAIPTVLVGVTTAFAIPTYAVEKYLNKKTITKVNVAGQKVTGQSVVLDKLERRQQQIISIAEKFSTAAMDAAQEITEEAAYAKKIEELTATRERDTQAVLSEAFNLSRQVKVLNAGHYGASAEVYDFVTPHTTIRLANHTT